MIRKVPASVSFSMTTAHCTFETSVTAPVC
jgi:hypothetical protein